MHKIQFLLGSTPEPADLPQPLCVFKKAYGTSKGSEEKKGERRKGQREGRKRGRGGKWKGSTGKRKERERKRGRVE